MQANPLRVLGDKGLNIGIRPYTNVGLAKETKAQKRGVGGPVEKSLICSPEALAQADELDLAEEPKKLSRASCWSHIVKREGHGSSWGSHCPWLTTVRPLELELWLQRDQQSGRTPGCEGEEGDKLKHTSTALSVQYIRDQEDSQSNRCRLPNSSSVPSFVLKSYGERDSRKCNSKLNQVNRRTIVWFQFLHFYLWSILSLFLCMVWGIDQILSFSRGYPVFPINIY